MDEGTYLLGFNIIMADEVEQGRQDAVDMLAIMAYFDLFLHVAGNEQEAKVLPSLLSSYVNQINEYSKIPFPNFEEEVLTRLSIAIIMTSERFPPDVQFFADVYERDGITRNDEATGKSIMYYVNAIFVFGLELARRKKATRDNLEAYSTKILSHLYSLSVVLLREEQIVQTFEKDKHKAEIVIDLAFQEIIKRLLQVGITYYDVLYKSEGRKRQRKYRKFLNELPDFSNIDWPHPKQASAKNIKVAFS